MVRRARSLVLLALLSASLGAVAQTWTVTPAQPTTQDPIYVERTTAGDCASDATRFALSGNRITITLSCGGNANPPPATTTRVRLGRLPEGTYQLDDTTFTVGPRAAGIAANDFSDLWWNPAEPGWGLNIIEHGDGVIVATWFVYASDGTPAWYVIPGGSWKDGVGFEGAIYRTAGPMLGAQPWPGGVVASAVGSATLIFGPSGLTAMFTVDGKTITKLLQRQPF